MCNCIKELEVKLKTKCESDADMGEMRPKNAVFENVSCGNVAFMMPAFTPKLNIPFRATWKVKEKLKQTDIRITASHERSSHDNRSGAV